MTIRKLNPTSGVTTETKLGLRNLSLLSFSPSDCEIQLTETKRYGERALVSSATVRGTLGHFDNVREAIVRYELSPNSSKPGRYTLTTIDPETGEQGSAQLTPRLVAELNWAVKEAIESIPRGSPDAELKRGLKQLAEPLALDAAEYKQPTSKEQKERDLSVAATFGLVPKPNRFI